MAYGRSAGHRPCGWQVTAAPEKGHPGVARVANDVVVLAAPEASDPYRPPPTRRAARNRVARRPGQPVTARPAIRVATVAHAVEPTSCQVHNLNRRPAPKARRFRWLAYSAWRGTRPSATATATSSFPLCTAMRRTALLTWRWTCLSEMARQAATWSYLSPWASSAITCNCLAVRPGRVPGGVVAGSSTGSPTDTLLSGGPGCDAALEW